MKRISVLFCISVLLLALIGCHAKQKRAKEYHDTMLRSVQAVIDSSLGYSDAMQSYKKSESLKAQSSYSGLVNQTLTKVQELKDFEGDTTLQVYSTELLAFYKSKLDKEINPFLQSVKDEAFSPGETLTVDSLMAEFSTRQSAYWDRFNWAEKKFYKDEKIGEIEK